MEITFSAGSSRFVINLEEICEATIKGLNFYPSDKAKKLFKLMVRNIPDEELKPIGEYLEKHSKRLYGIFRKEYEHA